MSDWLDAESHADRAFQLYERGRWAEAETELRKALSLNPDQAEWHFSLGLTLEAAGRDIEALASFGRAAELVPDQPDPFVSAGLACNRLGRYPAALEWFDRALGIDLRCEPAYAHKIDALVRLGQHDEAEATFYLSQHALDDPSPQCLAAVAESLIEQRRFDRAGWCLKEALRLEPHLPRLRARLAAVLAATGKPQRALQMYLRDLRDDPGNIDTLLDYGELLIDLGRLSEAAEKFRRVLEQEPANVDAHERLGHIAMATGKFEQAHLEYELVLKLDPQFPAIRLAIADALLRRNAVDAARANLTEELERANEEDGDRPVLARPVEEVGRFAALLLDADRPAEAAQLFEHVIERMIEGGRENAEVLRKLAVARFRCGDVRGGAAASRRVVRFDPSCVPSMHNLALAALRAGQLQVAAGWIARGLRVDRHDDGLRRLRMKLWMAVVKERIRRVPRRMRALFTA